MDGGGNILCKKLPGRSHKQSNKVRWSTGVFSTQDLQLRPYVINYVIFDARLTGLPAAKIEFNKIF